MPGGRSQSKSNGIRWNGAHTASAPDEGAGAALIQRIRAQIPDAVTTPACACSQRVLHHHARVWRNGSTQAVELWPISSRRPPPCKHVSSLPRSRGWRVFKLEFISGPGYHRLLALQHVRASVFFLSDDEWKYSGDGGSWRFNRSVFRQCGFAVASPKFRGEL